MTSFLLKSESDGGAAPPVLALRCPGCRRDANVAPIPGFNDLGLQGQHYAGHRRCPRPDCRTHVFVIWKQPLAVVASYPAQRVDFDPADVPSLVLSTFEEALSCEAAGCYVGAAMLIRKTLEQVCEERGASGKTLHDRLLGLKSKVILPDALFGAMDALRLLGNDAAHVESKTYDNIGKTEVNVGIALTKEILKATYQLGSLLGQLSALKKAP